MAGRLARRLRDPAPGVGQRQPLSDPSLLGGRRRRLPAARGERAVGLEAEPHGPGQQRRVGERGRADLELESSSEVEVESYDELRFVAQALTPGCRTHWCRASPVSPRDSDLPPLHARMRADLMMRRILGIGCAVAALYAGVLGITASAQEAAPEPTPERGHRPIAEPAAPPVAEPRPRPAEPEPPAETAAPPEPAPVTPPAPAPATRPPPRLQAPAAPAPAAPAAPAAGAGRRDQLRAQASPGQLEVGSRRRTQA